MIRAATIIIFLLLTTGCQSFKKLTEGSSPEPIYVQQPPENAKVIKGKVLSNRVVVTSTDIENAVYLGVKLCDSEVGGACIPLPFYQTSTVLNVTFIQDRQFLTIYNAASGLPSMGWFRVEYVTPS